MYKYIKYDGVGYKIIRGITPADDEITLQEYMKIKAPDRYEFAGISKITKEHSSVRAVYTRNAVWATPAGYVDGEANKHGESVTTCALGNTPFKTDLEKSEWDKKNPRPLSDWRTPNGTVGWW